MGQAAAATLLQLGGEGGDGCCRETGCRGKTAFRAQAAGPHVVEAPARDLETAAAGAAEAADPYIKVADHSRVGDAPR